MICLSLLLGLAGAAPGYVDLHLHLAAHETLPIYGQGPAELLPETPSHRHTMQPQLFEAELDRSDTALYVSLAYANPFLTAFETRASMRTRIERQLDYVEAFAARRSERYTLARNPSEARQAIAAGRTVIVHGIEGATKVIERPEDALVWARRGVAVVTPIHLADNPIGGAMCMRATMVVLNIPGCFRELFASARHGLTDEGKTLIAAMVDAGIVIDMAHTSPVSFTDELAILQEKGVAPVYTHARFLGVREERNALSDEQVRSMYALGGLVAVTANLHDISPVPVPETLPSGYCPGSIDDFRLQYDYFAALVAGAPVAWGSDFQGGIAHIRPKYGPGGCFPARPDGQPLDTFDTQGLAHVGLMRPFLEHLVADGSDRAPLDASLERFLRIWEVARGERG